MISFLIKLFIIIFLIVKIHKFIADELINPYKLICCIGKKGSGKTTDIAKNVRKDLQNGWTVYSNVRIPGAIIFDPNVIGKYYFPPNSSIYLDEIGLIFSNRRWMTFSQETLEYFKMQRQAKNKVTVYSQTLDFDVSLRNLIDKFYILKNFATTFTLKREIVKVLDVKKDKDNKGSLEDCYDYVPILLGGMSFNYIPKYIPLFKSYNPPVRSFITGDPVDLDSTVYRDGNFAFIIRFGIHQAKRLREAYRLALQAVRLRLDGVRSHFCDPDDGDSPTEDRDPAAQDVSAETGSTTTDPVRDMCHVPEGEEKTDGKDRKE